MGKRRRFLDQKKRNYDGAEPVNYDEMEAGRPMDTVIAEDVMNGDGSFHCPCCGGSYFGADLSTNERTCHDQFETACRWNGPSAAAPAEYSTSDAAAHGMLAKMRDDGWTVTWFWNQREHQVRLQNGLVVVTGWAPTFTLAACRATLKTKEVE